MRDPVPSAPSQLPVKPAVLATILAISCLTAMSATAITPSLPGMAMAFPGPGNSDFLAKIALTMPALTIALTASIIGAMIDRHGERNILIMSALLFALAGSAGLYAPNLPLLIVGRMLLGLAIAGLTTGVLVLVGAQFQGEVRQRIIGFQSSTAALGGMIFLILGGLLAERHWRLPFATYLLGLAFLPLIICHLPHRTKPRGSDEQHLVTGTIDWRGLVFAYAAMFCGMVLFYVIPVQLPFHLIGQGHDSPIIAGYALALVTLTSAAVAFGYGKLSAIFSPITMIALAFLLLGLGQVLALSSNLGLLLPGMVMAGIVPGLLLPTTNALVLASTPASSHGRYVGGITTAMFLGQFIAPFAAIVARYFAGQIFLGTAVASACIGIMLFLIACLHPFQAPKQQHQDGDQP